MSKMGRLNRSIVFAALPVALVFVLAAQSAHAISIDEKGEIRLGVRTYAAVRIGTEHTDASIVTDGTRQVSRSLTFPVSSSGSLRQARGFAEVELRHDLTRLVKEGFGPLSLLKYLPFKIRKLRYFLSYRGEYEGVYDFGPSEFRTHSQWVCGLDPGTPAGAGTRGCDIVGNTPFPFDSPSREDVARRNRGRLRSIGSARNRLFQAYLQVQAGKVTIRFGRQILAWGETDVFRLLDNINPLDASFGGFLVNIDERRVPLDMLRATWYLGDFSRTGVPGLSVLSNLPFYEAYLEGFISVDNQVGFAPGVPTGSAWGLPNVNVPSRSVFTDVVTPDRNFSDARFGFNMRFSAPVPGIGDAALGIAHYYTYFDLPSVRIMSAGSGFPALIPDGRAKNYSVWAQQTAPQVSVTGIFGNFAIPPEWVRPLGISGEPIVRFETAYFRNEPRNSQTSLDPFIHALALDGCNRSGDADTANLSFRVNEGGKRDPNGKFCTAGARAGDSWNVVLGLDLNQWVRFINPNSSLFITTQFFYKHLNGAIKREPVRLNGGDLPNYLPGQKTIFKGEVLPVQQQIISSDLYIPLPADAAVPNFVHSPADQFLQTLLITTPYYGGRILPSVTLVYDWHGAWVFQPSLTYSIDPFRLTMTYNFLTATGLQGGSGISLLRDRDNLLFQVEYVI